MVGSTCTPPRLQAEVNRIEAGHGAPVEAGPSNPSCDKCPSRSGTSAFRSRTMSRTAKGRYIHRECRSAKVLRSPSSTADLVRDAPSLRWAVGATLAALAACTGLDIAVSIRAPALRCGAHLALPKEPSPLGNDALGPACASIHPSISHTGGPVTPCSTPAFIARRAGYTVSYAALETQSRRDCAKLRGADRLRRDCRGSPSRLRCPGLFASGEGFARASGLADGGAHAAKFPASPSTDDYSQMR